MKSQNKQFQARPSAETVGRLIRAQWVAYREAQLNSIALRNREAV